MIHASSTAHDEMVVEIARLAVEYAGSLVTPDVADDISQQIALECLLRLRAEELVIDRDALLGLVRTMVRARAMDWLRRHSSRQKRNAGYAGALAEHVRPWMSPDVRMEDEELGLFYRRTLDAMRPTARQSYVLVREHGLSYREAAEQLGLSRGTVHWYVVAVQRRFRAALGEIGIAAPKAAGEKRYSVPRGGAESAVAPVEREDATLEWSVA